MTFCFGKNEIMACCLSPHELGKSVPEKKNNTLPTIFDYNTSNVTHFYTNIHSLILTRTKILDDQNNDAPLFREMTMNNQINENSIRLITHGTVMYSFSLRRSFCIPIKKHNWEHNKTRVWQCLLWIRKVHDIHEYIQWHRWCGCHKGRSTASLFNGMDAHINTCCIF